MLLKDCFFEECEAMASDSEVLAVADKVKEHTAPIMNAILRSVDDDKKGDVEDSVSEIAFYYQKALYEVGFRRAMLIILDVFSKGAFI